MILEKFRRPHPSGVEAAVGQHEWRVVGVHDVMRDGADELAVRLLAERQALRERAERRLRQRVLLAAPLLVAEPAGRDGGMELEGLQRGKG